MTEASKRESSVPGGGIPVSPRVLLQWTQDAANANDLIQAARMQLSVNHGLEPGQTVDSVLSEAQDLTENVWASTRATSGIHAAPTGFTGEIDIFQLDTPDTRELLAKLREALAIAERVDAMRGRCVGEAVPLGPGESRGTDLAESLSLLVLRVSSEVHGATGRGLE